MFTVSRDKLGWEAIVVTAIGGGGGLQDGYGVDHPIVWAFISPTPQSGTSTVVSLIAGLARLHGYDVELLTSHRWDDRNEAACKNKRLLAEDLRRLFSRLNKAFFEQAGHLYAALQSVNPVKSGSKLWLLDLGCSLSHTVLDLFWGADLQTIVLDARKNNPETYVWHEFSVRQRFIERALMVHDDSLHAVLKHHTMPSGPDISHPFWDSHKLRHLSEYYPLYYISNWSTTVMDFSPGADRTSRIIHLGTVPEHRESAFLLSALKSYHRPLGSAHVSVLSQRLREKAGDAATDAPRGSMHTPGSGLWVRINEARVLNLDLVHFDASAQNSLFAAIDDELF